MLRQYYSKDMKKYFDILPKEFDKEWERRGKPSATDPNYDKIYDEVSYKASMIAYEKCGFEKHFAKIQDQYKKAECRLILEWRDV